jgi:DNA invertase Pin-like site-specific DNA recombinase
VFTDEGYSGASLVRPALERLRDLVAQVPVDVVVCYSPDRLARKLAYQTLLIDELNKAGTEVRFVKARKVETPEDEMLLQFFQGMMAEYERALIIERTRRGKAFRARSGVVNVVAGAPFGYRYVRRTEISEARYEIIEDEAHTVREMFRRYSQDQVPIGELARWLTAEGVPTRTGKDRWDRSVVWLMLKNPAYVGRAAISRQVPPTAARPSTARLASRGAGSLATTPTTTGPKRTGSRSRSPPSSTRAPSRSPNGAWPTTVASLPATPKNPACSWDLRPANRAGTPTTAPPPELPGARSTTTAAWGQTTTATGEGGSVRTSRCAPTTWTRLHGAT